MDRISFRIKIVVAALLVLCFLIILRLFFWQVASSEKLAALAERQRLTSLSVAAERGKILASDGAPLALNQTAYTLYASLPGLKEKPHDIAARIAPILFKPDDLSGESSDLQKNRDEAFKKFAGDLEAKLSGNNLVWVALGRKVSPEDKKKIEDLKIAGLGFNPGQIRFYPEGSMSAHVLGFVGSDEFGDDKGYFGLEGFYDGQLRGRPGKVKEENDAFGNPILSASYFEIQPEDGRTVKTTIDRSIQYVVEKKLSEAVLRYGAKLGSVIVADPKTGAILAMANFPSYDPASWQKFDKSLYKNPIVADTYEPGSTFKVIGMSAAINEGLVTPQTVCDSCDGPATVDGFTIRTWNNKYFPNSTAGEVIEHSDNVGMVFVSRKLGVDKFYDYVKSFGFGRQTGIDLQDETASFLRAKREWAPVDLATASFGQGIAVTPIQMVRAVSAIANGGFVKQPYIVSQIVDASHVIDVTPNSQKQVIKKETADTVTAMMVNAVDKGEARAFKPKGYSIAGKTGTAQIPISGHYDPSKTIASFIGFAPAKNPQFIMLVRFVEPTSSIFGAETAAPTFFDIAKQIFAIRGIPPN